MCSPRWLSPLSHRRAIVIWAVSRAPTGSVIVSGVRGLRRCFRILRGLSPDLSHSFIFVLEFTLTISESRLLCLLHDIPRPHPQSLVLSHWFLFPDSCQVPLALNRSHRVPPFLDQCALGIQRSARVYKESLETCANRTVETYWRDRCGPETRISPPDVK